ncbi:hybrid sensor histidine kinase/response regulator [Desulfolutivibrio sulfoxidireducens]|uniref:hybrid sensor histidine kinase/response regulator n=1 Tax=Desulfolutivibrio sulfoxidireducens TaxID=2773299 RepID=UPI001C400DD5|nr:hybrid sensor histidine kinase/response regulator [Desulfolutivibrio sulfoxidireducens]
MNPDPFMLELFAEELALRAGILATGSASADGRIRPPEAGNMAEAARALASAARLVGQDGVAEPAGVAAEVLAACAASDQPVPEAVAGIVSALAGICSRLAVCPPMDIPQAVTAESQALADLAAALKKGPDSRTGGGGRTAAPPAPPPEAPPAPEDTGPELSDMSLLDLFRMELETHGRVLEEGLVAVEAEASPERIEPLMRAAHSIKGAARIVGLTDAVALAHAMEDVLETARKGRLALSPDHVDVLLAGTDVFSRLCRGKGGDMAGAVAREAGAMGELTASLRRIAAGGGDGTCPPPKVCAAPAGFSPAAPAGFVETTADGEVVVRIASASLNRFMGLAGECLVETAGLAALYADFRRIKGHQDTLSDHLDAMRQACASGGASRSRGTASDELARAARTLSLARDELARAAERFDAYARRMEIVSGRLYAEVVGSRMHPFSKGLAGMARMVRDLAKSLGKEAELRVEGQETKVDRDILDRLEAPLGHLIRNALDHGLEPPSDRIAAGKPQKGAVTVSAAHVAGMLAITVADDGRGIDPEAVRRKVVERGLVEPELARGLSAGELMDFLFLPGFSTAGAVTEVSGRGVGLDVVQNMVREVGGLASVESRPGQGLCVRLRLPLTLSVMRALLVEVSGEACAVPLFRIDRVLRLERDAIRSLEGRDYLLIDGETVGLVSARQILDFGPGRQEAPAANSPQGLCVMVVSDATSRFGLVVDRFLGERDLVVKPLDPRLGRVFLASAAAIFEDGSPVLILDVDDMVRAVDNLLSRGRPARTAASEDVRDEAAPAGAKRILVVDDSLTVREAERRLLANRGYEVDVAVDGMDGLSAVRAGRYDLVITDVDMPRVNGIELVRRLRADPRSSALAIMIVSYKDRQEDRLAGLDAGADRYLAKSGFRDEGLLRAVADLIGEPGETAS